MHPAVKEGWTKATLCFGRSPTNEDVGVVTKGTFTVTSAQFWFPAISVAIARILCGPIDVIIIGIVQVDQFPAAPGVANS